MLPLSAGDSTCARYHRSTSAAQFRCNRRRSVAACLVAMAGVFVMRAAWAQTPAFTSGEWIGSARRASDGTVELCQASNKRPDQYPRLYIGMDSDGETFLGATDKNWGPWKEGITVPVKLAVDGRSVASLDADAVDQRGLAIALDRKLLTATVMDGSRVAIETKRGTVSIPVNGVAELFTALEKCIASPQAKSDAPIREAPAADSRVTVLTCKFENSSAGQTALSCNNLTGFSLECSTGGRADTSTMTVGFDEQSGSILNRGQVRRQKFTETEITWEEPIDKKTSKVFEIERFSGAVTMYVAKAGEQSMTRVRTGSCQVAKDRLF